MAKTISASPPILKAPKNAPKSNTRGKSLAVVVSVDDPDAPQFATVAVNDHFPYESGFAVPMGAGPFAEGSGPEGNIIISATSQFAITQVNYPVTVTVENSGTGIQNPLTGQPYIVSGDVSTTFPGNITGGPSPQIITPVSGTGMTGISNHTKLIAGSGTDAEGITVTAVTATTFTAIFYNNHTGGEPITNTGSVLIFDSTGSHPETINVTNVSYNTPPNVGGTFQATFAYTHNANALITNLGSENLGYFYFYNNPSGVGGSICWVDLDTKQILSFTGYTSTIPPTPYYQNILTHRHNGNYDPSGMQNPGPINISYPETTGNLPYWQNTIVLQGVVDSDGNVIAVDFNAGMLKRISPSYAQNVLNNPSLSGMYEPLVNPIEDNVAFLLQPTQWLWVQWQATFNTAPTSTYLGPTFIDDTAPPNTNQIQVRFEPPANSNYPISTKFDKAVTGGGGPYTITPTFGTGMTGITNSSELSFGVGQNTEILTVSGVTSTTFQISPTYNHSKGDPIVAFSYGHVYCGTGTSLTSVSQSLFALPHDIYSNYSSLHWIDIGLQYVGGTQYRVIVDYNPNEAADTTRLLDVTFDSSLYTTGTSMVPPLLPGFTSDNLTDFQDVFFKKYEYRTTKGGNNGNPYPTIAPNLLLGVTPTFYTSQAPNSTTFDVLCKFDVDPYGHIPKMSSWGGQIVLLATQSGNNNFGQYGFLQPTAIGVEYNSNTPELTNPNNTWWTNLGIGSNWDLGIAYIDQMGNMTPVTILGTVDPPNGKGVLNLIINPALSAPSVATATATIDPNPPGDLNSDIQVNINLTAGAGGVATGVPFTEDYTKLVFFYRQDGRSKPWTTAGEVDLYGNGSGTNGMTGATAWLASPPGGAGYVYNYVQLANGLTYDFNVGFSGISGYSSLASPDPTNLVGIVNNPIFVHGRYMDNGQPVFPPSFSAVPSVGNVQSDNTLTCAADLQFSTNNQPTDGSLGRVGVYSVAWNKPGLGAPSETCAKLSVQAILQASHAGQQPPVGATGNYDATINDLNNGTYYSFWSTYISNNGKETALPIFFSYAYSNIGFSNGISSGQGNFYYNGNSGGYVTNGSSNLVAGMQLVIEPNGANEEIVTISNAWTGGNPIIIAGTFFHNHAAGVPVINGNGYLGDLDAANITMRGGNSMPAGITVTAALDGSYSYPPAGEGSYHASFQFTPALSNLSGDPFSKWGAGFAVFVAINDTGSVAQYSWNEYSLSTIVSDPTWTSGTALNVTTGPLSATHGYQVAIVAVDLQGNYSANVNPPGGTPWNNNGAGVLNALTVSQFSQQDNPNLVPDSDFEYTYWSSSHLNHGPPVPGWHKGWSSGGMANYEIYYCVYKMKQYINDPSSQAYWKVEGDGKGANCFAVDPQNDGNLYQAMGEPMSLIGGTTYCFSCYVNAVGCSTGTGGANPPSIGLVWHNAGSTLASPAHIGDTSISVSGPPGSGTWKEYDFITISDLGPPNYSEAQKISGPPVVGSTITLPVYKPLIYPHASGTNVFLNWNPGSPNLAQLVAEVAASFGAAGQLSLLYTPSGDQIVSILMRSNACKVSTVPLTFSKPMVQVGFYPGPYKSGPPMKN